MNNLNLLLLDLSDFLDESKYFKSEYLENCLIIYDIDEFMLFKISLHQMFDGTFKYIVEISKKPELFKFNTDVCTMEELIKCLNAFHNYLKELNRIEKLYTAVSKISYKRLDNEFNKILTLIKQGKTIYSKGE